MKETKGKIINPSPPPTRGFLKLGSILYAPSTATTDSKGTDPAANESYAFLPCILSLFPEMRNALAAFCARIKILFTAKVLGCLAPRLKGSDVLKPSCLNPCAPEVVHAVG